MTRLPRMALIPTLLSLAAFGCTSVPGNGPGFANRWKTMASSGGSALPTETGPPGATVAAELGTPEVAGRASGRISGRVIDDNGRPVPKAEVRLADGTSRVGRDLRATTDDAGGFTLRGLRPGTTYTLLAEGEVGRDSLVGRASARAPNTVVRIRLGPDDDGPATAEAQDEEPNDRRIGRVSNRTPIDQEDEDGSRSEVPPAAPSRSRRVNEADLPPADEATALDSVAPAGDAGIAKPSADKVAHAAWRREKSAADPERAPTESLERLKASEKQPAAARDPVEDEKNPLPPAKERTDAPLSPPVTEPAAANPPPAADEPKTVTPAPDRALDDPPSDVLPPSEAPPSTSPDTAVALRAEGSPPRRATWADVDPGPAPVSVATAPPVPMSRRRVPPGSSGVAKSDPKPSASTGRAGLLGLRGKKAEASTPVTVAAATCRYDAKERRIIDFQLPDLDGKATRFQDLDADFVLIDFWGTWCKPCIGSIPHLVDLQKQYNAKTLRVVGVATEHNATPAEQAQRVEQVARSLGVNYPLLLSEADGRPCPLQEALHIDAYPTMILVDRSGRILWRGSGAEEVTLGRLDRVIAARADTAVLRR